MLDCYGDVEVSAPEYLNRGKCVCLLSTMHLSLTTTHISCLEQLSGQEDQAIVSESIGKPETETVQTHTVDHAEGHIITVRKGCIV